MHASPSPAFSRALAYALLIALLAPTFAGTPAARAAGTPVTLLVNFQSPGALVPAGYLRDSGEAYGARSGANQGSGLSYGWVVPGTSTPLNLASGGTIPGNGRDRDRTLDQRLDTFLHMQADDVRDVNGSFNGTAAEGAWEAAVPNGTYRVTVSAGDAESGSTPAEFHTLNVEGVKLIDRFQSSGANGAASRHRASSAMVTVADGRLTVDATGGTNTKINYIEILSDEARPMVSGVTPAYGAVDVLRNSGLAATVTLPNGAIDGTTLNASTVRLVRSSDNTAVPMTMNTSGGGDIISLQPVGYLDANTTYSFVVTSGLKDVTGASFAPFTSHFTTGTGGGPGGTSSGPAFQQIRDVVRGSFFSSLAIGPDRKLYITTLNGDILRLPINTDGSLGATETISTVRTAEGGNRAIIGLAFDPAATAANPILWITHSGPYVASNAPDWTGKISRLSGANLETIQDYVVNLPHSYKDHMTNSLAFGPDGRLYVNVGSNSAMGAPDNAWGQRPERLLSGSVIQVNPAAITSPPLNVKTEEGGSYDPYAPGAPVTIYASGTRNAYDMVWHSNGQLYVPANGSAAGGNTPGTPDGFASSPACVRRGYTGPAVSALTNVVSQKDWLFRVVAGGYYGHPNPLRCEWTLNGGDPTTGVDAAEVTAYPDPTPPDPNWRGSVFDFGLNKSPNGAVEYKSSTFNGALKGKLLVVRYSQNDDIIVLTPSTNGLSIASSQEGLPGMAGFNNPLDLIEDPTNGNLYVIEFGPPSSVTLLRPLASAVAQLAVTPGRLVFTDTQGGTASANQAVTLRNTGSAAVSIYAATLVGADAGQFQVAGTVPTTINPGATAAINVNFNPTALGPRSAALRISSSAPNAPVVDVTLLGLGVAGLNGANEPSLQRVLDTYQLGVLAGDDDAATAVLHSDPAQQRAPLRGDEVVLQQFERADNANPVTIEPVAIFAPSTANPVAILGWYPSGSTTLKNELLRVSNSPTSNAQRLNPPLVAGATLSFDPGIGAFGFYSTWPVFANRVIYSEDSLNTFAGSVGHHVRVYPLKEGGLPIANAYVVAVEEFTADLDYQDMVFIVRNVKPFGSTAGDTTPPPAPAGLTAAGVSGAVNLSWAASAAPDVVGYRVYRSLSPGVPVSGAPQAAVAGTTYSDAAVSGGVRYYYVVVAVDSSGNVSGPSAEASAVPGVLNSGKIALENRDKYIGTTLTTPLYNDRLVFQRVHAGISGQWATLQMHDQVTLRIRNTATTPLYITGLSILQGNGGAAADTTYFDLPNNEDAALPLVVAAGGFRDLLVKFVAGTNAASSKSLRRALLRIESSDLTVGAQQIELAGFNMPRPEGTNEPTLQNMFDAFGYRTLIFRPGELETMQGGIYQAVGDEVLSPYWVRANSALPVEVRQLAALHQCCFNAADTNPNKVITSARRSVFGLYSKSGNSFIQSFAHREEDGQSFLPMRASSVPLSGAYMSVNATSVNNPFRVVIDGIGSERGSQGRPHGVRFWPVRDRSGALVPNQWLVAMDYVPPTFGDANYNPNYDYNDNLYLVTNIRPENPTADPNLPGTLPGAASLVLEFDRDTYPGTLADKDNQTTGFPDTQRNRGDNASPQNPPTTSYDKSLLNLDTTGQGTLTISSAAGTNQGNTSTSDLGLNNLVNGLCLPFDGRNGSFLISSRLIGPLNYLTTANQSTGILFGPDHNNYIRLTVGVESTSATTPRPVVIRLLRELNGSSSNIASAVLANPGSVRSLDLMLNADPATGRIEGSYRVDGGTVVKLSTAVTLASTDAARFFDRQSQGCVMATNRGTSATVPAPQISPVFDRFAITPPLTYGLPRTALARINAGGPDYIDQAGQTWVSDAGMFAPATAPAEGGGSAEIAGTADDPLYRDYRGKIANTTPLASREITFNIPVTGAQLVDLRLHFAEMYWGTAASGVTDGRGRRVFDVFAEDQLVLNDVDVAALAGGALTALVVPVDRIAVSDGALTLRLKAELDHPAISAIELFAQPASTNLPPEANAGPDQNVTYSQTVTLSGTGGDPDGNTPITYTWEQISGPAVTLSGTGLNRTFVAPATQATLTFRLTIRDGLGASAADTMTVSVSDLPITGLALTSNSPASNPRLINETVTFTATTTAGSNVSYRWNFGDGSPEVTTSTPTTTHAYAARGSYTASVTASNLVGSATATTAVSVIRLPLTPLLPPVLRINAGGGALTTALTPSGPWSADTYFVGGTTGTTGSNQDYANTADDRLFWSFRGASGSTGSFDYSIPISVTGEYIVRLHFAENFFTSANQREFDVLVEGQLALDNYDIFEKTGARYAAIAETIEVLVTDGTLDIRFLGVGKSVARVWGIEVFRTSQNQRPVANAGSDQTVPAGSPVTLQGSGSDVDSVGALTYAWQQTGGAAVTLTGANTATPSFTAPSALGPLTFSLVVTDSAGAPSIADTVTVSVVEVPLAGLSATSSSPTVLGQPTTFSASVSGGSNVTYSWSFGNGATATGASVSHTYPATGSYTVTVTASNSQGSQFTSMTVVVTNDVPVASAGPDQTVDVGGSVTLLGGGSDPDGHTPLDYAWEQTGGPAVDLSDTDVAQPTFTAPAAPAELTFRLVVTDATGLSSAPVSVKITVSDLPVGTLTVSSSSPTVLGQPTSFSASVAGGSNVTYAWSFGDGTKGTGPTPSHTYATAGSYTATVTATNTQGSKSATVEVTVTNAAPTASAGPDQTVDVGSLVTLLGGGSDTDGHTPLAYAWEQTGGPAVALSDTDVAQPTFIAPSTPTELTFRLVVTDATGLSSAPASVKVTVADVAVGTLTASSSSPTVLGQATSFSANVAGGSNLTYSWVFGDGATATGPTPTHTYATAGSYRVTVTASNSSGSQSASLTVVITNAAPVASAGFDQTVDVGSAVTLPGSGSDADGHTPLTFAWTQAGGPAVTLSDAAAEQPTFTAPAEPTELTFRLVVTDAAGLASAPASVKITVQDTAPAELTATGSTPTVLGQATSFSASVSGGSNVAYSWSFGNGATATGASVSYTYATVGTYKATVTASNSQGSQSATVTVVVTNDAPVASAGDDQTVDIGSLVTLQGGGSDLDGHTPLTYAWEQVDGPAVVLSDAAAAQPTFTAPAAPAELTFRLIVTDAAGLSSAPDAVTVMVVDVAPTGLAATSSSPTVLGQPTSFSAGVSGGSNITYSWAFGDGARATGASVTHTYAAAGSYTATVTAANGQGSQPTTLTVVVTNAAPLASAGGDQTVDVGSTVTLLGGGSDADGHAPLTYAWEQTGGLAVALSDTDVAQPTFTAPATPAVLTFALTVTDAAGLSSTADGVTITVTDLPAGTLTASSSSPTVLGQATSFTAAVVGGSNVTYSWAFGDGATATGGSATHTYAAAGSYTATVTAANGQGSQSATLTVVVTNAAPLASAGDDQTVDAGSLVTLQGGGSDPDGHTPLTFVWTQTGGPAVTLSDAGAAQLTFTAPRRGTTLSFHLVVTDAFGQSTSDEVLITVREVQQGQQRVFLPMIAGGLGAKPAPKPVDLVVSNFTVTPAQPAAGAPARIAVTVTNSGETDAGAFWVDLFINPSEAPTAAGQIWHQRCALSPCYGMAWGVLGLKAGESVTLTSTADSYAADYTIWPGYFAPGTRDLYVYVDSWGSSSPGGAVTEGDETNNRGEVRGLNIPAPAGVRPAAAAPPQLPARKEPGE